jgi:hypothetical protein
MTNGERLMSEEEVAALEGTTAPWDTVCGPSVKRLIATLRASQRREVQLRESLHWALEDMEDGLPGECPSHWCAFYTEPDSGHCAFHAAWAKARAAVEGSNV